MTTHTSRDIPASKTTVACRRPRLGNHLHQLYPLNAKPQCQGTNTLPT
jgi:hypothetical protein